MQVKLLPETKALQGLNVLTWAICFVIKYEYGEVSSPSCIA